MIRRINSSNILVSIMPIMVGVIFVIVMALKKLPIPLTTIEMSLQSLSISLLVIMLNKKASWVVFIYLVLATLGFPVLAGGESNAKWFLAPSAGYYFGFLISSFLLPKILTLIKPQRFIPIWLTFSLNESTILLCGFLVLSVYFTPLKAWYVGVWPFIFGAVLKISFAASIFQFQFQVNKIHQPV